MPRDKGGTARGIPGKPKVVNLAQLEKRVKELEKRVSALEEKQKRSRKSGKK